MSHKTASLKPLIIQRLKNGERIKPLANEFGLASMTIWAIAKQQGLRSPRGRPKTRESPPAYRLSFNQRFGPDAAENLIMLCQSRSYAEVGKIFGRSKQRIHQFYRYLAGGAEKPVVSPLDPRRRRNFGDKKADRLLPG